jgi:hypothetical protein
VVANVEAREAFADRMLTEAGRVGLTTAPDVIVLIDGAEWIWHLAADGFHKAAVCKTDYHAVEHIGAAVRAIWGETAAAARRDAGRLALVAGGKAGIDRWIADQFPDLPAGATGDELRDPAAYLATRPTWGTPTDWRPAGASAVA